MFVKPDRRLGSGLDAFGNQLKSRSHMLPVVERRLQGPGNVTDLRTAGQVAGNDDEPKPSLVESFKVASFIS